MNEIYFNNTYFSLELRHALDAAKKSCRCLNYLKEHPINISPTFKLDNTPVTIADYGSQIIIL
jgi:3'-phosphoadenosine 5'-phosphosulfate (PAPS) 3'-phosphatase